jgi:hypothetical protein
LRLKEEKQMGTNSSSRGSTVEANPAKKIRWTILLNIVADDVLTNFAVESLKQLNQSVSAPAGAGDTAEISVVAQFAFPNARGFVSTSGTTPREEIRRYIFKPDTISPLAKKLVATNNPEAKELRESAKLIEMANLSQNGPALRDFLYWVYNNDELKADHYALVLWGHGPELPASTRCGQSNQQQYQHVHHAKESTRGPEGLGGSYRYPP